MLCHIASLLPINYLYSNNTDIIPHYGGKLTLVINGVTSEMSLLDYFYNRKDRHNIVLMIRNTLRSAMRKRVVINDYHMISLFNDGIIFECLPSVINDSMIDYIMNLRDLFESPLMKAILPRMLYHYLHKQIDTKRSLILQYLDTLSDKRLHSLCTKNDHWFSYYNSIWGINTDLVNYLHERGVHTGYVNKFHRILQGNYDITIFEPNPTTYELDLLAQLFDADTFINTYHEKILSLGSVDWSHHSLISAYILVRGQLDIRRLGGYTYGISSFICDNCKYCSRMVRVSIEF